MAALIFGTLALPPIGLIFGVMGLRSKAKKVQGSGAADRRHHLDFALAGSRAGALIPRSRIICSTGCRGESAAEGNSGLIR